MKNSWDFLDIIGSLHCKKVDKYRNSSIFFRDFLTYRQYGRWEDNRLDCIRIFEREYPKYKMIKQKHIKYIFQILGRMEDRKNGE